MQLIEGGHKIEYVTHYDHKNPWVYVKVDGKIEANCASRTMAENLFSRYDNGVRDHHKPLPDFAVHSEPPFKITEVTEQ